MVAVPKELPTAESYLKPGLIDWITTTDHKKIAVMYGLTSLLFFLIGGVEALLLRIQLVRPNNTFLGPGWYDQLFTMHGTTMIFLVLMPLGVNFFAVFMVPLQIGVSIPLTYVTDKPILAPYRLPRRALGERWKVKIDPHYIDCVAFVCQRGRSGKITPGGTAFFVHLPDDFDSSRRWTYLVTSLHSLDEIHGDDFYIRVNTLPSVKSKLGYEDISTRKGDWFPHWNADVAAMMCSPSAPVRQKGAIE